MQSIIFRYLNYKLTFYAIFIPRLEVFPLFDGDICVNKKSFSMIRRYFFEKDYLFFWKLREMVDI